LRLYQIADERAGRIVFKEKPTVTLDRHSCGRETINWASDIVDQQLTTIAYDEIHATDASM
jgi:hypothetical protein